MKTDPTSIEFLAADYDYVPAPTAAAQHVPEWLKQMPPDVQTRKGEGFGTNSTLKRCMPFVDAMTAGYVIPIAGDVQFYMADATNLDIVSPEHLVEWQNDQVFPGAPFGQRIIVKFMNRWVVRTPPGYSTLFLPLLNQVRMPFQILAGLVETDTYYNQVHFPAICLMRPGEAFQLKRGTPIVQAIPIARETFKSTLGEVDAAQVAATKDGLKANEHLYRETNWEKKSYR